jgi:hypothetical protein
MFERAAVVELAQLEEVLEPPCALGPYLLTGQLKRSETAIVVTARGGALGDQEGVLKLSSSHHVARLQAELQRLVRCANAGVPGVIRPATQEPDWLPVPGLLDAHVATLAMPFLSGGDLNAIRRTHRTPRLAHEVALTVGAALRHMLELSEPLVHGSLGPRSVLLPYPGADLSQLMLIDLGNARDLADCSRAEATAVCRQDVVAFGALLHDLTDGPEPALRPVIADCRAGRFASLADPRLWRALRQRQPRWLGLRLPW